MRTLFYILSYCFIILLLYACGGNKNGIIDNERIPIVSVNDKTLYKAELNEALPVGLTGEDSIIAAKAYIDTWINDLLIYGKAERNILNKNEIDALVEDYRKSLIVNSYQEQLVKDQFAKTTSDRELKSFYEQNRNNFVLEDNIIKGLFLKIPANSPQLNNFTKWYKQGNESAVENIEKNTLQNAVYYEYFYDKWVSFEDVLENIPSLINDKQRFLQNNKNLEIRDSAFVYLLNIKEYKLTGNEAPFEYIKGTISEIYIEQKKADYLKQVKKDLYEKALSDEKIKFYEQ